MAFCENCGTALSQGAKFCGGCGRRVAEGPPAAEQLGAGVDGFGQAVESASAAQPDEAAAADQPDEVASAAEPDETASAAESDEQPVADAGSDAAPDLAAAADPSAPDPAAGADQGASDPADTDQPSSEAEVATGWFCTACGAEHPVEAAFCSKCGERRAPGESVASSPAAVAIDGSDDSEEVAESAAGPQSEEQEATAAGQTAAAGRSRAAAVFHLFRKPWVLAVLGIVVAALIAGVVIFTLVQRNAEQEARAAFDARAQSLVTDLQLAVDAVQSGMPVTPRRVKWNANISNRLLKYAPVSSSPRAFRRRSLPTP